MTRRKPQYWRYASNVYSAGKRCLNIEPVLLNMSLFCWLVCNELEQIKEYDFASKKLRNYGNSSSME